MTAPTETRRAPLLALLAADGVSRAGNAITTVAIPLIALDIGGTPLAAAAAGVAATLPLVIGGLLGGVVVDRLGFRRASIVADAASGATVLAVPCSPRWMRFRCGRCSCWCCSRTCSTRRAPLRE